MPRKTTPAPKNEISIQLDALRDFTAKFGALHDAQVLQLKIWPRLMFPHSKSSEARVDVDGSVVTICVKTRGKPPAAKKGPSQKERTEALARSVQWMLGSYWNVMVYENGKKVYDLRRKTEKPDSRKYEGTDFRAGMIVPEKSWYDTEH